MNTQSLEVNDLVGLAQASPDVIDELLRRLKMIDKLLAHCSLDGGECAVCATIVCPSGDTLHFHHDGCPSCE